MEKIARGNFDGEIRLDDFKDDPVMGGKIEFNSFDLEYALHGIHKIEYQARPLSKKKFSIIFTLFDVYDFKNQKIPSLFIGPKEYLKNTVINALNMGEGISLIRNFEVEIYFKEMLYADR